MNQILESEFVEKAAMKQMGSCFIFIKLLITLVDRYRYQSRSCTHKPGYRISPYVNKWDRVWNHFVYDPEICELQLKSTVHLNL